MKMLVGRVLPRNQPLQSHLNGPKGNQVLSNHWKKLSSPPQSSSLATSRSVTSTVETPNISRPVTPTIPYFSQNADVINVTIYYGGRSDEQQEYDFFR